MAVYNIYVFFKSSHEDVHSKRSKTNKKNSPSSSAPAPFPRHWKSFALTSSCSCSSSEVLQEISLDVKLRERYTEWEFLSPCCQCQKLSDKKRGRAATPLQLNGVQEVERKSRGDAETEEAKPCFWSSGLHRGQRVCCRLFSALHATSSQTEPTHTHNSILNTTTDINK